MTIRTDDVALLAGRLALAALFLPAGIVKLGGLSGLTAMLAGKGLPFPDLLAALAVAVEIGGGVALILGVMPRLTAVALVGFTLVASLISHAFWTFPEAAQAAQQTQFFKNLAIAGGLLFYYASGAGALSAARLIGARPAPGEAAPARA